MFAPKALIQIPRIEPGPLVFWGLGFLVAMAESSWDDAALVTAFNAAIEKYKDRHNPEKQRRQYDDGSSLENQGEKIDDHHQENAEEAAQQAPDFSTWPGSYPYPYYPPFPQPVPGAPAPAPVPYPYPFLFCPVPCVPYPGQPLPGFPGFQPQSSATDPSFETLKQAVMESLAQLPDKQLLTEDNAEVLTAWFNAGFRTASHLYKRSS